MNTVNIYGNDIKPEVGSYILLGDRLVGEKLVPGTDFADAGFRGCPFYLPTGRNVPKEVAVDIDITGRTLQRRPFQEGNLYVKVKVTFIGDCEPDTYSNGWMLVK